PSILQFPKAVRAPLVAAHPSGTAGLAPSHTPALPPCPQANPRECAESPKHRAQPSLLSADQAGKRFHPPVAAVVSTATTPLHQRRRSEQSESNRQCAARLADYFLEKDVNNKFRVRILAAQRENISRFPQPHNMLWCRSSTDTITIRR